jgi:hypothetical protein
MDAKMQHAEDIDSEEEQERIEEEKEAFTLTVKALGTETPVHISAMVLVLPGNPLALTKIIFDSKLTDFLSIEVTQNEKTKESLKV